MLSSAQTTPEATISDPDEAVSGLEDGTISVSTDSGLRQALATRISTGSFDGPLDWELIGVCILRLAERESRDWHRHAVEYESGFAIAVVELMKHRPQQLVDARSPWGLAVTRGRQAGLRAVGAHLSGGLTARDPIAHGVRYSSVPRVLSFDVLVESADLGQTI